MVYQNAGRSVQPSLQTEQIQLQVSANQTGWNSDEDYHTQSEPWHPHNDALTNILNGASSLFDQSSYLTDSPIGTPIIQGAWDWGISNYVSTGLRGLGGAASSASSFIPEGLTQSVFSVGGKVLSGFGSAGMLAGGLNRFYQTGRGQGMGWGEWLAELGIASAQVTGGAAGLGALFTGTSLAPASLNTLMTLLPYLSSTGTFFAQGFGSVHPKEELRKTKGVIAGDSVLTALGQGGKDYLASQEDPSKLEQIILGGGSNGLQVLAGLLTAGSAGYGIYQKARKNVETDSFKSELTQIEEEIEYWENDPFPDGNPYRRVPNVFATSGYDKVYKYKWSAGVPIEFENGRPIINDEYLDAQNKTDHHDLVVDEAFERFARSQVEDKNGLRRRIKEQLGMNESDEETIDLFGGRRHRLHTRG